MSRLSPFLRFLTRWQYSILLFLTIWLLFGLTLNASNLTEFNLQQMGVEAIVERGVFYVDGSPTPQLQPQGDVFELGDHLYAAKQPGQFMAGALVYFFLYHLGLTYLSNFLLASALVTWLTAGLVTALATVAVFHIARALARDRSKWWALGAAGGFALATIAFPYAEVAHHDAIASGYLVIAFGCVLRLALGNFRREMWLAGLAGILLGLTFTTSALPVFMAAVVGLYFLSLRRWKLVPAFAVGVVLGLLPLLYYDAVNFGNPFLLPNIAGNFSDTYFELDPENFLSKLRFYVQQLTLYAPLVWLGLVGLFFLPRQHRRAQLVMFGMLLVLVGYVFNIDTDGDCQFGPRYLLPAMPYVAIGLVGWSYLAARTLRRAAVVALVAVGLVSLLLNTTGALYGVMYCDLPLYALPKYLSEAQQGKFEVLPLLPSLLPWFAVVIAGWFLLFAARLTAAASVPAQSLRWYQRAARTVLGYRALTLITLWVATFLRLYRLWELPPALWIDEAFYGLDALRVLRSGYVSAFFPQNGGREPLFIYLQSAAFALLSVEEWAVRIVPALVGILTVAIMVPLGRTLFRDTPRARYVGLAAAAVMAVLYWHVDFSRLGFRAILLPATSALTIWWFWHGWQTKSYRYLVLSGAALGVTLYTYLSARLLPFVLVGFAGAVIVLYLWNRWRPLSPPPAANKSMRDWKFTLGALGIVLAVMAVVLIPLGLYFGQHPEDFIGRSSEVSITPENIALNGFSADTTPAQILLGNVVKVARIFIDSGDANLRHNLPYRPALDPLMVVGFFVSLGAGLWTLRRSPVYALLFLWLLVMIAPSVFSLEAPHFLRMIGAIPPIVILVADGLTRVWQRVSPRLGWSSLIVLILLVSGTLTFRDYFLTWANLPNMGTDGFDISYSALGKRVKELSTSSDILLPTRVYGRSTLQFALAQDFDEVGNWDASVPLTKPLVIATTQGASDKQMVLLHRDAEGKGHVYFLAPMPGAVDLRAGASKPILDRQGAHVGNVIPLKDEAKALLHPPSPTKKTDIRFANGLRLIGFDVNPSKLKPDGTVELALYWQPDSDLDRDYSIFVHVLDSDRNVQAQWDSQPVFGFYTMGLWRKGAIITDLYPLHIPADAAPGLYKFEVGLVGAAGDRLSVVDENGNQVDDAEILGRLQVEP